MKFHEEEPLTAEDVAFSINRALHPISQFKTFTAGILGAEALPNGDVLIRTINHSPVLLNQYADERCMKERPEETEVSPGHTVRCHKAGQI